MAKKIEKINENKVSLKLFGYDKYFNDFFNLYDKSKFPKVSLLSGDKGLGKYTFIFHLILFFIFFDFLIYTFLMWAVHSFLS